MKYRSHFSRKTVGVIFLDFSLKTSGKRNHLTVSNIRKIAETSVQIITLEII